MEEGELNLEQLGQVEAGHVDPEFAMKRALEADPTIYRENKLEELREAKATLEAAREAQRAAQNEQEEPTRRFHR